VNRCGVEKSGRHSACKPPLLRQCHSLLQLRYLRVSAFVRLKAFIRICSYARFETFKQASLVHIHHVRLVAYWPFP